MSIHEDDDQTHGPRRRRRIAVAGAAGLAALVGVGAVVLGTRDDPVTQDTGVAAPVVVTPSAPTAEIDSLPGSSSAPVTTTTTTSAAALRSAAPRTPSPRPATPVPDKVRKQIDEARQKAAREGHPLQRPLTTPPQAPVRNADSLTEQTRPLPEGGTMRIISARYDLSHRQEMLWAADSGKPAGVARCTQNFRFAQNASPAVRPTMLLCWRNTEDRSVVVLSVTPTGHPEQAQTLDALSAQWDRLG